MDVYGMCEILRDRKDAEIKEVQTELQYLAEKLDTLLKEKEDLEIAMMREEDFIEYGIR